MSSIDYSKFTIYSASAGAGKTHTIMEQLVNRLESGTITPSQIIATTFTKKAAAELRGRLRKELFKKQLLVKAQELPSALIGTVNSVTGEIVKIFSIDAGLDPDLSVLDEDSQKEAFRIATEEALYAVESKNRELLESLGYKKEANSFADGTWESAVRRICELARTNDIGADQLRASAEASWKSLHEALGDASEEDFGHRYFQECLPALEEAVAAAEEVLHNLEANPKTTKGYAQDLEKASNTVQKAQAGLTEAQKAQAEYSSAGLVRRDEILSTPFIKWIHDARQKVLKTTLSDRQFSLEVSAYQEVSFHELVKQATQLTFDAAADALVAYEDYKKARGLIDFIDQEHLALKLLRDKKEVQKSIADRYKILVVDEFQDTSPLQLAVFMELAKHVDEVMWVGDPKQSIYRFRGADPELMNATLEKLLEITNSQGGETEDLISTLGLSYRTSQVPLEFSNQVFARALVPHIVSGPDNVILKVPEERLADGLQVGGEVQIWRPAPTEGEDSAQQNADVFDLLAAGIAEEIAAQGEEQVSRAVLVRSNEDVQKALKSLTALGIPVAGDHYALTQTRELLALRAALAYAQDASDSKALIELIGILPDHPAHQTWLNDLTACPNKNARWELFSQWGSHETLAGLRALSAYTGVLAPSDFVRRAIDALDLPRLISTWTSPHLRFTALDGAVQVAKTYEEKAAAAGRVASLQGYLDTLNSGKDAPTSRFPQQKNSVTVMTMHKAKGLEWDHVYVAITEHEAGGKFFAGGSWVEEASDLDLENPLAGRSICFWPIGFKRDSNAYKRLGPQLETHKTQTTRLDAEIAEEQRLYYVALTRSKKRTVIAQTSDFLKTMPELFYGYPDEGKIELLFGLGNELPSPGTNQPTESTQGSSERMVLRHNPAYEFPTPAEGETRLWITAKAESEKQKLVPSVPVTLRYFGQDAEALVPSTDRPLTAALEDGRAKSSETSSDFLPARFVASMVKATEAQKAAVDVVLVGPPLGPALMNHGGQHWDAVGNAVHGFLALPLKNLSEADQLNIAQSIIDRWGVGGAISSGLLLDAARRWRDWVEAEYPAAAGWEERTEVPFTWTNDSGQSVSGWIDSLLIRTTATGVETVVVDHKTFPGEDPESKLKNDYVGQMGIYSRVIEDLTGAAPSRVLMHLPMRGEIWEMVGLL